MNKINYTAFGQFTLKSGSDFFNFPALFHGEYYNNDTGLSNYGYRYYSPILGRWLSRDPIEERGGLNLYAFVANNPLILSDKYGLSSNCCNSVSYDEQKQCCCGGKIYDRRKPKLLFRRCCQYGRYSAIFGNYILQHCWVEWGDKKSLGFYPKDSSGRSSKGGSAACGITVPGEYKFPEDSKYTPHPENAKNMKCEIFGASECEVDFEEFERAIDKWAEWLKNNPENYNLVSNNCQDRANFIRDEMLKVPLRKDCK